MLFSRLSVGSLLVAALSLTCGQSIAGNLDPQIAERMQQYQKSIQQRAAQLSPTLQAKIESQTKRTISKGLKKWKKGEVALCIALPQAAENQRIPQFVARHTPGLPSGSLQHGICGSVVALTVTSLPWTLKSSATPAANFEFVRSTVCPLRQSEESVSYFVRIACTIVQRT